jgi:hypothetical protein
LYKKGTFHHKKGHFWSFEKIGGGGAHAPVLPPPPGSYAPELNWFFIANVL